jgi:hypothetical protein
MPPYSLNKQEILEQIFFIVQSLRLLEEPLPDPLEILRFVESCRRNNGGSSRSRTMGIPTIEYTYMAVSIFTICCEQTKGV